MKVIARVRLNDEEREFDIACGNGERSFKWLASAGMQRWAQAVPHGNLRRCDLRHGITDNVQYSTTNVLLPSGEIPHPEAKLREFLRYGDQVIINLTGSQKISLLSGLPKRSAWNSVAFTRTVSLEEVEHDPSDIDDDDDEVKYDENGQEFDIVDTRFQVKSKVLFREDTSTTNYLSPNGASLLFHVRKLD